MTEKLEKLVEKYNSLGGIMKGAEFLLPPGEAIDFAEDLEAIGVTIMGVDGWCYVDKNQGWIVQDLTVDFSVDDKILHGDRAVEESSQQVKEFIKSIASKHIDFVSFTLNNS